MTRRLALTIGLVLATALTLAPAASAGTIVYRSGADIWAMNDDGSGQKQLIALAEAPEMEAADKLGSPSVAPAGTSIAFTGVTNRHRSTNQGPCPYNYNYSCPTVHYGNWATGIYRWDDGTVKRLTDPPSACSNCTWGESSPSLSSDGQRLLTSISTCSGFLSGSYTCNGVTRFRDGGLESECKKAFTEGAVNPADSSQFAYFGCYDTDAELPAVTVAGAGGERTVACDDEEQEAVAWSPDGSRLATLEVGEDRGIWSYAASSNGCGQGIHLLQTADVYLEGLTYAGADRIVFQMEYDLWSIPTSCNGCTFPASATRLTTNGDSGSPSWTSEPLSAFDPSSGGDDKTGGDATGDGGTDPKLTPLQKQIAKKCGALSGKKRKLCVKRVKAIAKCKQAKAKTKKAKRKQAACISKAKKIGKPKRKANR